MVKRKKSRLSSIVLLSIMIIFAIITIYQIIIFLFGGSWSVENLALALISVNVVATMYLVKGMAILKTEMKYVHRDIDRIGRALMKHLEKDHGHSI